MLLHTNTYLTPRESDCKTLFGFEEVWCLNFTFFQAKTSMGMFSFYFYFFDSRVFILFTFLGKTLVSSFLLSSILFLQFLLMQQFGFFFMYET